VLQCPSKPTILLQGLKIEDFRSIKVKIGYSIPIQSKFDSFTNLLQVSVFASLQVCIFAVFVMHHLQSMPTIKLDDVKSLIFFHFVRNDKRFGFKRTVNTYSNRMYKHFCFVYESVALLFQSRFQLCRSSCVTEALHGMEAVAEHINEMQKIYEEYGRTFDELVKQYRNFYPHSKVLALTSLCCTVSLLISLCVNL